MLPLLLVAAPLTFGLTPASYWASHWATGPRIPSVGDVDGDGRADLVSLHPTDNVVDVQLTTKWGKPTYGTQARRDFGRDGVASTTGPWGVLGVSGNGEVRLTWGMDKSSIVFPKEALAATIPADLMPPRGIRAFAVDMDGDGQVDAVLVGADGRTVFLRNKGGRTFAPKPLGLDLKGFRAISAGSTEADGKGRLWWTDGEGVLWRGAFGGKPERVAKDSPDAGLAVGRFRGGKRADVLFAGRLFPGGDPAKAVATPDVPKTAVGDLSWLVADFDGNGKDDLFRMRATGEPFSGEDRFIHFAYDEKDPYKGYLASAEDGIPDCWKTGHLKPGGLDLKALGCRVGRRDLVLEVQTFEDVPEKGLRAQFDRVAKYFASLPIDNPDGSKGIAVHTIVVPPRPVSEKGAISGDFDRERPPVPHRGVVHWVQVFKDVGGVATIWGTRAQVNESWQNVIHELGHNFGLIHEGYQDRPYSPIYGSIMSYSYSYGIDDDSEKAGYSSGLFKDRPLDERHLDERLPFPIEKAHFLSGRPYHYPLKEVSDGTTLIDWNWNGIFGEKDVAADIDWEAGRRTFDNVGLGRANATPVVLEAGGRLVVLSGQRGTADGKPLAADQPGKLTLRTWIGPNEDAWSGETLVEPEATGDAAAASVDGAIWTACPTRQGVAMRRVDLQPDGGAKVGEPFLVPATVGAVPTLAVHGGELRLLLWRDPARPIGVRGVYTDRDKPVAKSETPVEGLLSLYPVGAVSGGGTLWVSAVAKSPQNKPKWRLFRLNESLKVKSAEWSAGEGAGRLQILWEADKAFPATGQTHVFARGGTDTTGDIWTATRTAYPQREGGWLQIHHDVGGAKTRSAPGVAFFRGDIAMAMWREDGSLYLSFHARGIRPEPVRDYDDVAHIARIGLQQSINVMER